MANPFSYIVESQQRDVLKPFMKKLENINTFKNPPLKIGKAG